LQNHGGVQRGVSNVGEQTSGRTKLGFIRQYVW
jgi:hypothetical protein